MAKGVLKVALDEPGSLSKSLNCQNCLANLAVVGRTVLFGIPSLIDDASLVGYDKWWILLLDPSDLSVRPRGDAVNCCGS